MEHNKHYPTVEENVKLLREIEKYDEDWDGEGGLPFGADFVEEIIRLLPTLPVQPEIGPTGRGSIDLEIGVLKPGERFSDIEIYEENRRVVAYCRNTDGNIIEEETQMQDIKSIVQRFLDEDRRRKNHGKIKRTRQKSNT